MKKTFNLIEKHLTADLTPLVVKRMILTSRCENTHENNKVGGTDFSMQIYCSAERQHILQTMYFRLLQKLPTGLILLQRTSQFTKANSCHFNPFSMH